MKHLRRRLLGLIIALLLLNVGLVAFALSYPYGLDRTFFSIEYVLRFYKSSQESTFENLVLGDSSVAYGIMARRLPNTLSLAIPSSTSVSSYSELRRFKDAGKKANCLIFYNSYIKENLWRGLGDKYPKGGLFQPSALTNYLEDLSRDLPSPAFLALSYRFHYYTGLSVRRQYHLRKALYPSHPGVARFSSILDDLEKSGGHIRSAGQRSFFDPERHSYLQSEFTPDPIEDAALQALLKLTRAEKMRFVFVGIPVGSLPQDARPQAYEKAHWEHVRAILEKYQHAKFIAPKIDVRPLLTNDDFFDINHFNEPGAQKFTDWAKSEIENACHSSDQQTQSGYAPSSI